MRFSDPTHLDRVRNAPCCYPGCHRLPPSDPHHLPAPARNATRRSNDYLTVPLCREHHRMVQTRPSLEESLLPIFYARALELWLGDDPERWRTAAAAVVEAIASAAPVD